MTTQVQQIDGVSIVKVNGRVALGDGDGALLAKVHELLDSGQRHIVLNLEAVPYMDSSGVGRLVECFTDVREHDGSLKLANASPKVRELLRITGLHRVLEEFLDEHQAVVSF